MMMDENCELKNKFQDITEIQNYLNKLLLPQDYDQEFRSYKKKFGKTRVLMFYFTKSLIYYGNNDKLKTLFGPKGPMLHGDITYSLSLHELCSYKIVYKLIDGKETKVCVGPFDIDYDHLMEAKRDLLKLEHYRFVKSMYQKYLNVVCSDVINFIFPNTNSFKSHSERMSDVVKRIQELKKDTNEKQLLLTHQRQLNRNVLSTVLKQVFKCGNHLESLITEYRFSNHPLPILKYKAISMKAHLLKLRSLELEILRSTYTSKSIHALRELDKAIEEKKESVKNNLLKTQHKLSAYQGLDPEFNQLLKEFANLQTDIKFFKYGLQ